MSELSHDEKSEIVLEKLFNITGFFLDKLWTVLKWIAAGVEGIFSFVIGVSIFLAIFFFAFHLMRGFVLFLAGLY